MTLKKYIEDNYQKEYGEKIPKYLDLILISFSANHIDLEKFQEEFSMEEESFLGILSFITDDKNAYEIAKYGYRCYEAKKTTYQSVKKPNKLSALEDYSYGEPIRFTKRFTCK